MNLTVCPLRGPGSIPSHGEVFQGIFSWLITLCQPVLSQRGRKGLNPPPNSATQIGHRGGMPKSNHGQTMADGKIQWGQNTDISTIQIGRLILLSFLFFYFYTPTLHIIFSVQLY